MKELNLITTIQVYSNSEELPPAERELLEAAKEALDLAYAPYSGFNVGAAARLENGEIVKGSNQENAAYTMCICAERVALSAVSSNYPEVPVVSMAVTVRHQEKVINQPATPCGACRQVIRETEQRFDQPIQIILQGETGEVYVFKSVEGLLPLSFDNSFLRVEP